MRFSCPIGITTVSYTHLDVYKRQATTIIRILKDETYTGTLVQGKQTTPHFKLKEREDKLSLIHISPESTGLYGDDSESEL